MLDLHNTFNRRTWSGSCIQLAAVEGTSSSGGVGVGGERGIIFLLLFDLILPVLLMLGEITTSFGYRALSLFIASTSCLVFSAVGRKYLNCLTIASALSWVKLDLLLVTMLFGDRKNHI